MKTTAQPTFMYVVCMMLVWFFLFKSHFRLCVSSFLSVPHLVLVNNDQGLLAFRTD